MKVLCAKSPNLSDETMQGWTDALSEIGFDIAFWDSRTQPIFDAFDENEPDIFISTVIDITRGVAKCLAEYRDTVSLFYSPHFDLVSSEDVGYMQDLANDTGKPDYIFSFCHGSRLDETLGGWKVRGYKTLSVMRAANTKLYYPRKTSASWASDVALVADYHPYLDPYVLPLCHHSFKNTLQNKMKIRIFGEGWPVAQGIGKPEDVNIANVYASSLITLDIHYNDYEPSDTPFNVAASGGFCLSNSVNGIIDDVPNFNSPDELHSLVRYYCDNPNKIQRPTNVGNHTYKNRMTSLLKTIGFEDALNEVN